MTAIPSRSLPWSLRWMLCALCLLMLPAAAMAQARQTMTPADQAEIAGFKLNEDVITRMAALTAEGRGMQIKKATLDMGTIHSLDDMAAQVVAGDPRIEPLMRKHGFTPHQFLVANLALVSAAMAANMQADPEMAKHVDASKVNMDNVRFYQAHQAQIDRLMQGG
ncbi:MAG TPA: hypothetical protein VFJ04_01610 [Rhodanobacteraceae bacterium]|jgi:hypothetical protein|nr:hypothetical protein [Rhodanobacteraceae bacterium]